MSWCGLSKVKGRKPRRLPENPNNKICPHCDKEKSKSEFSIDYSRKSGLQVWCKECVRKSDKRRNRK